MQGDVTLMQHSHAEIFHAFMLKPAFDMLITAWIVLVLC